MKNAFLLPFLLLLCLYRPAAAQQRIAASFQEAGGTSYSLQKLDSLYQSAVHDDPSKAVFTGQNRQKLEAAYQQLVQEASRYLAQQGFRWSKPVRCFNRFYFSADGSIDYYLFHLNPQEVSAAQQAEYKKIMDQFIQTHRLQITGPQKFAQCSPVVWAAATE